MREILGKKWSDFTEVEKLEYKLKRAEKWEKYWFEKYIDLVKFYGVKDNEKK